MLPLKDLAIKKALENNWKEACDINKKILEDNSSDIDALNRLAFSYIKLGKYSKARSIYKQVIKIDDSNPIALKNIKKIDSMSKQDIKNPKLTIHDSTVVIEDLFIEEAGKTKTVELKNIADRRTLSFLQAGDMVSLVIKRSKIFVQAEEKKYIGMLPDNVSMRLIPFMKGGNEYQAYIKSVNDKNASIFIKEVKKVGKFKNQQSFNISGVSYQVFGDD
ncbi:MAG: hypothetical protein A2857_06650 [Candidatus Levybacteria bacterium RIFCSPHIGHO2_01_FULL_36_15]|nr:MAG: hypothetical protein A2857_06650 [Candidatus Levybacteria bacterium RIFCSPHIGHO2_01_FULL_36_15]